MAHRSKVSVWLDISAILSFSTSIVPLPLGGGPKGSIRRPASPGTLVALQSPSHASGVQATFQLYRRTLATLIKLLAETRDIHDIMGHASSKMTLAHYVQPVTEIQRAAVDKLWNRAVVRGPGHNRPRAN